MIDIDQFTSPDGSKSFVLLDYDSLKKTNPYSVWFGVFSPGDTSPKWGNQKELETDKNATCFSVKLFSKTLAMANCIVIKTGLITSSNKDIMYSMTANMVSPIPYANANVVTFDKQISAIAQRKLRIVTLGNVKYVMLFSPASSLTWSNSANKSLLNVLTFDGTNFSDIGKINMDNRALNEISLDDLDTTKSEILFLSKSD